VFDLDGTLVDSEPCWVRGFTSGLSAVLEDRGLGTYDLDPAEMARFQGGRVPDSVRAILDWLPLPRAVDQSELGSIVDAVIGYVTAEFVTSPTCIPEAVSAARELHRKGVPLAIASSSAAAFIEAVVDVLDLEVVFPVRVSAVGLPLGKPDPSVYHLALAARAVPAELSVAVEDSPVGVLSAVRAGMGCLWFLRDGGSTDQPARLAELTSRAGAGPPRPDQIEGQVRMSSTVDPRAVMQILDELTQKDRRP
jgi:beta-phosphoglucomutase-like phosphatase (HAD superfamily)